MLNTTGRRTFRTGKCASAGIIQAELCTESELAVKI
jgi:hypothetical protein